MLITKSGLNSILTPWSAVRLKPLDGQLDMQSKTFKEVKMTKKIKPEDNSSNIENANKGTPGTNRQYDQNQGNRGKQLDENQQSTPEVQRQGGTKVPNKES